jgi:hypothetical protein
MINVSNIIALLTDFGTRDHYVGVMKGVILSINPHATIVDISHDVAPQDITSAYFLLKNSHKYFPSGTIFVAVVDPEVGMNRAVLCAETDDALFLAPDNGALSFVEQPNRIVSVTNRKYMLEPVSNTFHGRDIFAPVAGHLSLGLDIEKLGPHAREIRRLNTREPEVSTEGVILGEIVAIDQFGNLVTNIAADRMGDFPTIEIKVGAAQIKELSKTYGEHKKGEVLALIGSGGTLEISVSKGNAAKKLKVAVGDVVRVRQR